jgi:hypothetical protein
VLGYALSFLLQIEMEKLGYDMSINKILHSLNKAKITIHIDQKEPSIKISVQYGITNFSEDAEKYIDQHDLLKYLHR